MPGFQDAHVHPVGGGLDMLQCDLHDLSTEEEYLLAIKTYAEEHPEREWILGGGWSMDVFPGGTPTKELLDALVPTDCVPPQPRRPQHVGQLQRPRAGGHHEGHAGPCRWADRANRRR